ncbi:protein disulfide-isomerase-like [Impatiens glandulifera]|uniref:protein disulfide-isomerase-like n=1 Tax=Impatiens glandulifera TaxID=253017 RepID=UPI001FB14588|nr:protein disulfide-isomerase-like [Impatiens glandulifera]
MASRVLAAFILLISISSFSSAEEKEHVLTLDHSNFTDIVSKHDFIVVEFYAPWCGHCKSLAPEYEKAASVLSSHDPAIVLAKLDASDEANKELGTKFGIQGFPTIKILRNGGKNSQEYKGPREADGIVDYLKRQLGPASSEIKSAQDSATLIDEKKISLVGIFPKFAGEEYEKFTALAEKLRSDYGFAHTLDAKLIGRGDSSVSVPTIRLLKPFDERFVDSQNFDLEALEKFIEESSVPTLVIFDNDPNNQVYLDKYFNTPSSKVMAVVNFSSDSYTSFRSTYEELAASYKGKGLIFLLADLENSDNLLKYFGLNSEQVPLILVQKTNGDKYFKDNLTPNEIAPWLKDFVNGAVRQFIKSAPIPETNDEPVKVVVTNTLAEFVFTSTKNVLIEFYAPWCGHCKKLAPILEEVAVHFEKDAEVVIAKLDATENDVPGDSFEIQGYPTMYFKSASGKLVSYDGDRTKEAIIEYIEKNKETKTATAQTGSKDEL